MKDWMRAGTEWGGESKVFFVFPTIWEATSGNAVGSVGGVADVDFRRNSGGFRVTFAQSLGKWTGLILVDEVDGASAKAAAGEPRAEDAR